MSDVGEFLLPGMVKNEIPDGWLVIFSHFLERVVPVLCVLVRIKCGMLPGVCRPPIIVQPHVEASIRHRKSNRLCAITAQPSRRVHQPVLVQHHWLPLPDLMCILDCANSAWNPVHCVQIPIFSLVYKFFERVSKRANQFFDRHGSRCFVGELFGEVMGA